jgi:signal transduction histidine kinase
MDDARRFPSDGRKVAQSRAERLIAWSRLVLALSSLLAIYLDPIEPSRYIATTYGLLIVYSVYAAALAIWNLLIDRYSSHSRWATHAIDLAFFSVINFLTEGPASPFFVYFVFSVFCAILRFGLRGTVATAVTAVMVFLLTGGYLAVRLGPAFELNRFIIRAAYLGVVATLLAYLAAYQERRHRDLARIATWTRGGWRLRREMLAGTLDQATGAFDSPRALLAYEYLGARVVVLARRNEAGEIELQDIPPDDAGFLGRSSREDVRSMSFASRKALDRMTSFQPEFLEKYRISSITAAPLQGQLVTGQLFFLDRSEVLQEDLNLARIVASIVGSQIDHFHAMHQLQRGALSEERLRLGRNLHDSLLQSLTGVALQLRTIPRLMERDPATATDRLGEIAQVIASDQKDLRSFIDDLQNSDEQTPAAYDLAHRLESLRRRFAQQWELRFDYRLDPAVQLLPEALRFEIYSIVSEAVANAAKHAAARQVTAVIGVEDEQAAIDVRDDGQGFSFHGTFTLRELIDSRRGPVTLKERVASLGGDLTIDSTTAGSAVSIRLPTALVEEEM